MRRKLVFGIGLAGVLSGSAVAQFASDRTRPAPSMPPSLPSGYEPAVPASRAAAVPPAYVPPAGGVLPPGYSPILPGSEPRPLVAPPPPMTVEIKTAIPANHEWLLKPEHGAYFISVKSYSRPARPAEGDHAPTALAMAEALAAEIRDLYRVQTFLYEHISEERKSEMAAIAAARVRGQVLAAEWERHRNQAQLQGMQFLEPDQKVRFKTVNYKDQIAVLIGGFKTDEDARKALDKVRAWPAPKTKIKDGLQRETSLMDWGSVVRPGPDGKQYLQESFINPYETASVVPNPTVARPASEASKPDPFLVKLNEGRPYNLMSATKAWTLGVKSFSAPVEIVSKDSGNSVMKKFGTSKGADVLAAGAEQAESLAKALRAMKTKSGESLGLEAFVLHTRNASLVTVGQFDGPNDPEMLRIKQLLGSMKMNVSEDPTGLKPVSNAPSIFGDNLIPMPVPRP